MITQLISLVIVLGSAVVLYLSSVPEPSYDRLEKLPSFEEYIYAGDIAQYEKEFIESNKKQEDSLDAIYYSQYLEHLEEERERNRKWRDSLPLEYYLDSMYINGGIPVTGYID